MNINTLETSRLIIREFNLEDAEAVYEFGSNAEVQKHTGNPLLTSLDEAAALIKNVFQADYHKHGFGRWAVIYKPDNKVIGFAGLKFLEHNQEIDLGYRFLPNYWNLGIATEASKPIVEYGFKALNLDKIIGVVMQSNPASVRVLEKLGFEYYKTAEYDGDGEEHLWYQMLNGKAKF
jgi:ribosomal-protein-alanine N-acetyltransferase